MPLRVGSLELQSSYLLAPLEGVSDVGFRHLCYANGAGITYTEMVRASGIVRRNAATLDLIDTYDPVTLTGLQLFAVNERELKAALAMLDRLAQSTHPHFRNIRAIDLNFGCPSPEIIRIGAGPALLKRASKIEQMFTVLRDWKESTKLPIGAISAKIRLGLNEQEVEHKVYVRVATIANSYLDFLTVHARHARQRSSDAANWDALLHVREILTIPLIGNGDGLDVTSVESMRARSRCDGVLIARGAIRDPWIFDRLRGGEGISDARIAHAHTEYLAMAHRWKTKEKFVRFHEENFRRMLAHASAKIPTSSHG